MNVEITPSEYTDIEAGLYGDRIIYERGIVPAEARIEFEDWDDVEDALRHWQSGANFGDIFGLSDNGPDHAPRVQAENIAFVLRDQPAVVAPRATTEPGRESSARDETILRGVIFCCACLLIGCVVAFIIYKFYL